MERMKKMISRLDVEIFSCKGIQMKKELFAELVESIKEGGKILRGHAKPKRAFKLDEPDVRRIRRRLHLSQSEFSTLFGISPATLRNWEQSRRKPQGPARVLLRVAEKNPESVLEAIHR
jgi:putative transcriptional regulator